MGYYTHYDVSVESDSRDAAVAAIRAMAEAMGYHANWLDDQNFYISDAKWYEWEKDVAKVSASHHGAVFLIEGNGEDHDDIWRAWAYAGNVETIKAEITFPEPSWLVKAKARASAVVSKQAADKKQEREEAEYREFLRLKAQFEPQS